MVPDQNKRLVLHVERAAGSSGIVLPGKLGENTANPMADTFCRRLVASFESRRDRVAMRIVGDESEIYTFGEMLRMIRAVAYRLDQQHIGVGDCVALIGENHPSWAIAYLGILYRGAVCVPLDPQGEVGALVNFIEDSDAKIAFVGSDVADKFRRIEEKLSRNLPAVTWSSAQHNSASAPDFRDWTSTHFPEGFATTAPTPAGDDIALLIYTSGTTGTPKGVPLTHGNILAELDGINEMLHLSDQEKVLSLLPLFHAYLQIVNLWIATVFGCEVGYLKELTPAELLKAMQQFKPTILTTVPRLWYLFHKKIFDAVAEKPKAVRTLFKAMLAANGVLRNTTGLNLGRRLFGQVHETFGGRMRLAISAGSRFDEDVATDFHNLGFTILQGYGLTETSGAATATYEADNRVGSVGKPVKGAEVKLDSPGPEGVGEVLIRGPMVFSGYYKNSSANAEAFTADGWFRSGDLGRFDSDGNLYIVGRAKDVIVLPSGKNVHPEDLEIHYLKSPLVEEIAVIGVNDPAAQRSGAEKLAAVVVPDFEYLKHAKVANSREAIRYALDNLGRDLPEYQRVRDYIIRAEPLPRTGTRKIKRFKLKEEIEKGSSNGHAIESKEWTYSGEDRELLETSDAAAIVAIIRANAPEAETIHPSMNLEIDLGLDSLARAETFAAIEQRFGKVFEAEVAAEALTVKDVISLVEATPSDAKLPVTATATTNWSVIIRSADEDIPELRKALEDRPLFAAFAFSIYKIFYAFSRVFMRLEINGYDNLRSMRRPFLICPNHQSYLDPFVLCSSYPFEFFKNTFHVGASEFFSNRLMGWVARMLHVVPVNPDTHLMRAMKAGAIGLKRGRVLNIYPEGERAYDGDLHKFKKGAAILATELELPILPVAMDGLHKVWPRRSWRIRPAKVKITFGRPFYARDIVTDHRPAHSEQTYEIVTAHLKKTVAEMIEEMRNGSEKR